MATTGRRSLVKRMISRNALRRGLFGGNPFWRFVWFVGLARRLWAKVSKSGDAPIVFSEDLPEGEVVLISHSPERSRRGRGEGRRFVVGPKRTRPRISSLAASAAYAAARRALETQKGPGDDDRSAS